MKKQRFYLFCAVLSVLLIAAEISAICGYWYSTGNVLVLISAVMLLISSLLNYHQCRTID